MEKVTINVRVDCRIARQLKIIAATKSLDTKVVYLLTLVNKILEQYVDNPRVRELIDSEINNKFDS